MLKPSNLCKTQAHRWSPNFHGDTQVQLLGDGFITALEVTSAKCKPGHQISMALVHAIVRFVLREEVAGLQLPSS